MFKSVFKTSLFAYLIFTFSTYAQGSNSIQICAGIISPRSSNNGSTGLLQIDFPINSNFVLYFYSGYAAWDQYNISFLEDYSQVQKKTIFNSYAADGHVMIPLYAGGRIHLNTNKLFTSFVNVEFGYAHLSYNSYTNLKNVDPATGEVLSYYVNKQIKNEVSENLFGIGIGVGVSHPLNDNLVLLMSFKINSYLNSQYYEFFSSRSIYTAYLAGVSFRI